MPVGQANKLSKINNDPPRHIKQKLNRRNNLIRKKTQPHNSLSASTKVKTLNKEIKKTFTRQKEQPSGEESFLGTPKPFGTQLN